MKRYIIRDDNDRIVSVPEDQVQRKSQIIREDAPYGAETFVSEREDPPAKKGARDDTTTTTGKPES